MVSSKKRNGASSRDIDKLEAKEPPSSGVKNQRTGKMTISLRSSNRSETEVVEKPVSIGRRKRNEVDLEKTPPAKKPKGRDLDSQGSDSDSDTSVKEESEPVESQKSSKKVSGRGKTAASQPPKPAAIKAGKTGKAGGGPATEKQKLREKIKAMILDAGWTIDYRPRRGRDYHDAVYVSPSGSGYWSITKAYNVLMKETNRNNDEDKSSGAANSAFTPIAADVLNQLTRNTQRKRERERKNKQSDGSDTENKRKIGKKKPSSTGKSSKGKINENGIATGSSKSRKSLHDSNGGRSKKHGRCTLLVRSSNDGQMSEIDGLLQFSGKRTLLSWLIDSGAVRLSQKVLYMNKRRTKTLLEGWITSDGIHCGCCGKIISVSKFESHAGMKSPQPFQNICLESGVSLQQCQIDTWNKLEKSEHLGFQSVSTDGDDPNDDTCGICGDGGDLICCDGCPSTFHQSCLYIQMLPPGDWHCPHCTCKICGVVSRDREADDPTIVSLLTCSMCEKKYHKSCANERDELPTNSIGSSPAFCGQKCQELFESLQKYVGIQHELEEGFSWSLIHRVDADPELSSRKLLQRVENNSKLAVALNVMDECFLPIKDMRSGISIIHNVIYNCGSNFNRLNYGGFYTAILEKGDEMIAAASIRFHGEKLAEMPYIGTRHNFRRQGMCRRLFGAIKSALSSMNVELLVLPAIPEFVHQWTVVFGFTPVEDSIKKAMKSMNMMVFPGVPMLQKQMADHKEITRKRPDNTVTNQSERKDKHIVPPEEESDSDKASSMELQIPVSAEGTVIQHSPSVSEIEESGDEIEESGDDDKSVSEVETIENTMEIQKNPPTLESSAEDYTTCSDGDKDNASLSDEHEDKISVSPEGALTHNDPHSVRTIAESSGNVKKTFEIENPPTVEALADVNNNTACKDKNNGNAQLSDTNNLSNRIPEPDQAKCLAVAVDSETTENAVEESIVQSHDEAKCLSNSETVVNVTELSKPPTVETVDEVKRRFDSETTENGPELDKTPPVESLPEVNTASKDNNTRFSDHNARPSSEVTAAADSQSEIKLTQSGDDDEGKRLPENAVEIEKPATVESPIEDDKTSHKYVVKDNNTGLSDDNNFVNSLDVNISGSLAKGADNTDSARSSLDRTCLASACTTQTTVEVRR